MGSSAETVDGTAGTEGPDGPIEIDVIPAPGGMRRLTPEQYVASVRVILGDAAAAAAVAPPLPQLSAFDAQTVVHEPLTPLDIEAYESSAMAIGTALMDDPSPLAAMALCINAAPDSACYATIARELGRMAWRRPLEDPEVAALTAIAEAGREWGEGNFLSGLKYEVAAILQSPHFLYVVEVGTPSEDDRVRRLGPYELASRLSFFLVGHTPDRVLLDRAAAGDLDTDEQVRAVARELLERPEARERVAQFYDELYRLRELATKGKDADLFPLFTPSLAAAMRQETQLLIQNVVFEEEGDFLSILDANYTFVNDALAQHYGFAPPAFPWQLVTLPIDTGRAGVLTQAGFLSVFSHPNLNSPTRRGLFVQEILLCTEIQPPPPDVMTMLPTAIEGQTLREWLEQQHNASESCAGCHQLMDPVGYAFERFDPVGAVRQLDNGLPINSSGTIAGLGAFANAKELASLVRDDPRAPDCVVRNLYRGTMGTIENSDQADGINALTDAFVASNNHYKTLLLELAVNPLFRLVDAPK